MKNRLKLVSRMSFTNRAMFFVLALLVVGVAGAKIGLAYADSSATVSGTFTVNSTPVPGATVNVDGQVTTTDANGNYSISGLPAGTYQPAVSYSQVNIPGVP